jgi:hypothetical protein
VHPTIAGYRASEFNTGYIVLDLQFGQVVEQLPRRCIGVAKRMATVCERQGHPPAAGKWAMYFYQGQSRGDLALLIARSDHKRTISIAFGEQVRPGRMVKDVRIGC